jgi:hypothetical protein
MDYPSSLNLSCPGICALKMDSDITERIQLVVLDIT